MYPRRASEFEIQAYLFAELRAMEYDVRGEVDIFIGRCDLIVFDENRKARRGIEVKAVGGQNSDSFQARKYREQLHVPVDVVGGLSQAHQYVLRIRRDGFRPVIPKALPTNASVMCRVDFSTLSTWGNALDHVIYTFERAYGRAAAELKHQAAQIIRSYEQDLPRSDGVVSFGPEEDGETPEAMEKAAKNLRSLQQ